MMDDKKRYYGNFVGIVIANNDPLKNGRVKIFIPHISPNVYNNWNVITKDKKFKFLGKNITSDLTDVTEDLKAVLPWAECASPLVGESSSGRYNSFNQTATVSDSNDLGNATPKGGFKPTKYSQNNDGVGEKPANIYEKYGLSLNDAFVSPILTNTNKANLYGQNYKPSSYSNKAKGAFCIPSVGAHLWLFFVDGDPMFPVYFAASHGADEWQSVYQLSDYPGSYENRNPKDGIRDNDVETYRNKYLINQKGGTLEFINTDKKETVNLTHYSGSFLSFTNPTAIFLATANEQRLIMGDKFETVRGSNNFYSDGDSDFTIKGDYYKKLGSLNYSATQQWKDIVQSFADIKQRFEIQRVRQNTLFNSVQQTQNGSYGPCPVCSSGRSYRTELNAAFGGVSVSTVSSSLNEVSNYTNVVSKGLQQPGSPRSISFPQRSQCPACGGSGKSTSSMGGNFSPDPIKQQLNQLLSSKIVELSKIEAEIGMGGHEIIDISKHKVETIGLVMNDFGSIRVDLQGKMYNSSVLVATEGVYENQAPSPLIEYVHVDDLPGGNYTLNVCNKYTVQVGAGGISLKTFGPIQIGGTVVNVGGEQINMSSSNEVNIDGGKRLTITSDIMVLKQRQLGQVMVDSSLGVSRNLVVGGGAHIEGELTLNHVTAPVEIQETEQTIVRGTTKNSNSTPKVIGYVSASPGGAAAAQWLPVYSYGNLGALAPDDDSITISAHSHHFRNLPLTLVASNNDLRNAAKASNGTERNAAAAQNNSKKGP
jgi:hypothetical protein